MNKNYYAKCQDFHNQRDINRLHEQMDNYWCDRFHYNKYNLKSWKDQSKKRKQWM